jgi:hypothetical protein
MKQPVSAGQRERHEANGEGGDVVRACGGSRDKLLATFRTTRCAQTALGMAAVGTRNPVGRCWLARIRVT